MNIIKADGDRRIEIPGILGSVPRPVDIDEARTGFKSLRTLRIYQFERDSIVDGHAEEDEVFIVVLSGSAELTILSEDSEILLGPVLLSSPDKPDSVPCAAYLPPHAGYRLILRSEADIGYARATPRGSRPPAIFSSQAATSDSDINTLLEETSHAERLRMRLIKAVAHDGSVSFTPLTEAEAACEALVCVRALTSGTSISADAGSGPSLLASWDTVTIGPGEAVTLAVTTGSGALVLAVMAD